MKYEFIMPIMRKYSFNNNKIYGGPTDEIFGSDDGFALFLNGMGFSIYYLHHIWAWDFFHPRALWGGQFLKRKRVRSGLRGNSIAHPYYINCLVIERTLLYYIKIYLFGELLTVSWERHVKSKSYKLQMHVMHRVTVTLYLFKSLKIVALFSGGVLILTNL